MRGSTRSRSRGALRQPRHLGVLEAVQFYEENPSLFLTVGTQSTTVGLQLTPQIEQASKGRICEDADATTPLFFSEPPAISTVC